MTVPTPKDALAVGRAVLAGRHAGADAVFVAGSIMRGAATAHSDVDLVVLYPHRPHARRESFVEAGRPVEAFIHDAETLRWYMDQDAQQGRPVMLSMLAQGTILGPRITDAVDIQAEAARRLIAGPVPLSPAALDGLRYRITDMMMDLEDARPRSEIRAIGTALMVDAAALMLRSRGHWIGAGKWLPRTLAAMDTELAHRFDAGFEALLSQGETGSVLALLDEELARHGGRLFGGFVQDAPIANRRR